jgi:hypothetical protein
MAYVTGVWTILIMCTMMFSQDALVRGEKKELLGKILYSLTKIFSGNITSSAGSRK